MTFASIDTGCSSCRPKFLRGLEHLRDRLGERFVAGLVLNSATQAQRVGDRLAVAPVDALWRGV